MHFVQDFSRVRAREELDAVQRALGQTPEVGGRAGRFVTVGPPKRSKSTDESCWEWAMEHTPGF